MNKHLSLIIIFIISTLVVLLNFSWLARIENRYKKKKETKAEEYSGFDDFN